ncbi:hypothetical protein [Microbulbifer thermotolerans]|uniref:hypothetical protein n=1 Tax=Microbulbifer thermotolerans TaxID=252514 RepID=UPI002248C627|nr:hypothetical protein [Microbulbifer thermotolerans]MCX2780138.1 hypothetical protein [Microbulbifer thermotolerans]MCX2805562.1 hypothetical protein [Microbulbifer thermotolerans]MCX2831910.1 hypothetical protein [Microbulbifer thermotolerans]MCX2842525.1 hypothetical protein [Microbulbifer thermotolerans]
MRYKVLGVTALVCLGGALVVTTGDAEPRSSAAASARITLRIMPRAQLHPTDIPGAGELCLDRIPADRYHISIRDLGGEAQEQERLVGRSGNYCLPVSTSAKGKMVVIVAE